MNANNNLYRKISSYKMGIIGVGMTGGAQRRYFEQRRGLKPFLYDSYKKLGSSAEVNKADIIFICVPTPHNNNKGHDLSIVKAAIRLIKKPRVLVVKSTVLPGTTETLQKQYPRHTFLFNPEFLTEVTADQDMQYPDRQIALPDDALHPVVPVGLEGSIAERSRSVSLNQIGAVGLTSDLEHPLGHQSLTESLVRNRDGLHVRVSRDPWDRFGHPLVVVAD